MMTRCRRPRHPHPSPGPRGHHIVAAFWAQGPEAAANPLRLCPPVGRMWAMGFAAAFGALEPRDPLDCALVDSLGAHQWWFRSSTSSIGYGAPLHRVRATDLESSTRLPTGAGEGSAALRCEVAPSPSARPSSTSTRSTPPSVRPSRLGLCPRGTHAAWAPPCIRVCGAPAPLERRCGASAMAVAVS